MADALDLIELQRQQEQMQRLAMEYFERAALPRWPEGWLEDPEWPSVLHEKPEDWFDDNRTIEVE